MEYNVCGTEKYIRGALGILIILAGLYYGSWWGAVGLIPLLTAIAGYCPLNRMIQHSSCPLRTTP
jgi:Protein of unknown function (DUF2892)